MAIDHHALPSVQTRYGPALDLHELGANKVLAIFDRAAARDFVDLVEVAAHILFDQLVDLAMEKDRGLTLPLLARAFQRVTRFDAERFGMDPQTHRALLQTTEQRRRRVLERAHDPRKERARFRGLI